MQNHLRAHRDAAFVSSEPMRRTMTIADGWRLARLQGIADARQISRAGWFLWRLDYERPAFQPPKGVATFVKVESSSVNCEGMCGL